MKMNESNDDFQNKLQPQLFTVRKRRFGTLALPTFLEDKDQKETAPDIGIIGLQRLFDPTYNKFGKCFWLLCLVASFVACAVQVGMVIEWYFRYPVTTDVTLVPDSEVTFPSFLLCPSYLKTFARSLNGTVSTDSINYLEDYVQIDGDQVPITQKWNMAFSIHTVNSTFNLSVPCERDQDCDFNNGKIVPLEDIAKAIPTVWGSCIAINYDKNLILRGRFTFLRLQTIQKKENSSLLLFIYPNTHIIPRHDVFHFAEPIKPKITIEVFLKLRKFKNANSPKNPCVARDVFLKCRDDCINKELAKVVSCRMPFVVSSARPNCTTFEEAYQAFIESYQFYTGFNTEICKCPIKCTENLFTVRISFNADRNIASGYVLKFYYLVGFHELVEEKFSYNFASLLSDIGGNVGIFLGCCTLTVVEILEYAYNRLRKAVSSNSIKTFKPIK